MFAALQLFASFYSEANFAWLQSVSVAFAVIFAALISSICDYGKQKQFLNLQAEIIKQQITVLRGQYGTSQSVFVKDLCVGDIVLLEAGDRVPADCLLIREMDMFVDQSHFFAADDSHCAEKQCSTSMGANHLDNPDPILLAGSLVM